MIGLRFTSAGAMRMSNHLAALQSILQLSAALNATFTVIFSIYDSVLQREQDSINALINSQDILINNINTSKDDVEIAKSKKNTLKRLLDYVVVTTNHVMWLTSSIMRPICLFSFIISIFLLVYTSFCPDEIVSYSIYTISLLTIIPFFICFIYVIYQSLRVSHIARRAFDVVDGA